MRNDQAFEWMFTHIGPPTVEPDGRHVYVGGRVSLVMGRYHAQLNAHRDGLIRSWPLSTGIRMDQLFAFEVWPWLDEVAGADAQTPSRCPAEGCRCTEFRWAADLMAARDGEGHGGAA